MKVYTAWLLGLLGSFVYGLPAKGADVLLIRYQTTEVQILRQDFEEMAQTGALPNDLEAILGEDFQLPQEIRQLLARPLTLPAATGQFLKSDTGEFLLKRLDRLISSTSGQQSENLTFLRSAFIEAADQQQVSFLDLIRQYPQETVKVNLTGLEQTYQQVVQFVDNIKTESNSTRKFLAELFCDCPQAQANTESEGIADPIQLTSHCTSKSVAHHSGETD